MIEFLVVLVIRHMIENGTAVKAFDMIQKSIGV